MRRLKPVNKSEFATVTVCQLSSIITLLSFLHRCHCSVCSMRLISTPITSTSIVSSAYCSGISGQHYRWCWKLGKAVILLQWLVEASFIHGNTDENSWHCLAFDRAGLHKIGWCSAANMIADSSSPKLNNPKAQCKFILPPRLNPK